jgi:uncharacterized repeat protein (TIGR02543 family)
MNWRGDTMKSIMHLRWVQKAIHLILVCAMVLTPMGQIMPVVQAESGETAPREESALSLLGISSDPVGLKDLPAGSLLQFAGYDWIVLNPANGMLIMQSSYSEPVPFDTSMPGGNVYFNPGSPSNIGYLLNTTFFNSLSALDQSRIRTVTWEIGPQGREWDHIMDAKVGLLNWNQVQTEPVASQLQSFLADSWLLTWYAVDADASWWASGLSGNYYLGADLLPAVETDYSEGHEVHPVIYLSPNTPTLSGAVIPPQNEILSFSVPNQRGESSFDTETSTITFTVTDSVNLTSIIPLISLSSGATSQPANGVVTDLSNPTTCTVRSADGFEKVWVLVARVLSTRTDISEFSVSEMMLVSEENYAIINRDRHTVHFLVPADTDITQLTPSIFAGMEATLSPLSGTPQDFTSPITYRVTAEAGNTQDWVVTCVRVGDNVPYTVEHYQQDLVGLGYTLNNTQTLSGILSSEVTATVQSASGFVENTTQSNRITSGTTLLDGSLTLRLYYDRTLHSVTYEEDGGSNIPDLTSLRYGSQLTTPQTPVKTGYQFLGWFTDAERTQAASFPMNLTGNKTFYAKWQSTLGAPGDITGFTVRNQIGNSTITRSDWWNSIDLVMPIGSDLRAIAPVITTVAGTTISPASGEVRDFSGSDQYPVEYAADYGGEYPVTWNVRVTIEEQPLNILTFTVPGQLGNTIINPIDHTVKFVMPSGSDVTALRPLVTVPSGNGVYTGFWWGAQNYYSPSAVDAEDFSYSVEFHVIGSDSLEQTWTATCIIQSETAGYISSFTVPNQVGNSFLDMVNHRVVFHMPYGSDATNLQPTITVPAGSTLQPLAESVRNYSGLVYFNVTAPGGTPELWTVQCIVDLNAEKSITDVTLENQKSIIVDDSQHTIVLSMPVGTDITSLAPQFQISAAAEIFPASGTPKNFTSPQKYLVYAEDGTSQLWTVSVVMLGNVTVEHYQMMPAGNWYGVERSNYYYDRIPGSTFTAESAEFTGFIENTSHTSRIPSGTVQAGQTLTLKLYYDRLPYTVQFVENGGSEIDDLSNVLYGTWPTRPTPPVKAGYQLENWYTDPELTNAYQFNVDITQDLILYAKWEVAPPVLSPSGGMYAPGITVTADKDCFYTTDGSDPRFAGTLLLVGEIITVDQSVLIKATSYFNREFSPVQEVAYEINTTKKTVTFESNHGSAVASQEIAYGHSAVLPPTPTQYGYTFVRWCSDFWLSQAYDFSSIVQEDITLYAQWVIGTYTLSFDTQGGSTIEPITAWFGTYLDAPAPPTKTGYTFKQWNPVFQEYMSMPGEDTTLTAEWTTNQYTLHFNTAGGTSVADQLQTWNLPITAPAAPTKTGYTFSGWSPAIPDLMPMQDFTVTAQWTAKQYTITFDSDGGSAVSAITQDYGTPLVSPENPTKMGYEFGGWTPYLPATMPAENLTLTAYWGANFYTITLNTNGGNLIDPIRREVNTDLVAPADPQRAGYTFLGWDPVFPTKMPAENLTLVAQWQANSITLQFDSAGGSTVASIVQNCDTNLTPPANPSRTGYTFNTWSPVLPAKIPTANQTYTAIWNINSYTISFDTVGGSEIESITEPYNTTLSQPTNPTRTGYQFTSWLPSFPAKMPAENLSLVAQWSPNIYTIIFDSKGGSAVAPLSQEYLKAIVKPTDPSKAGYSFIGWYTNTENTIEYDFATPMSNDLTLYAGWQIQNYRVIFRNWNGELLSEEIVQYLGAATPPVVPDREPTAQYYFAFYGWNGNPNSILGETTFTAVFLEDLRSYTVYYLDTTGVEITTQTIDYDDWAYEPQQPYREGLTFMGWFQESTLLNEVEFPVLIQGDVTYYASFKRPDNEILSFSLANQVGDTSIHSYYGTVSLLVPWHTDRTQLVPTITVSPGAQVSPASGVATDLSNGKNYTVTAEDGSQKQWLVSVNEAESPNEIESFKVSGQNGESIIDPVARTVVFHMPFGSDVTAVRPEVRLTYGAYSNIGWYPNINYGGRDPVDFTDQVKYTVITDQQGSNSYWQEWYVTCVIDPNTANDFTAFSVEHQVGNSEINATERTILFHVPYGTDVTNLQPQWTLSANATVSVGASTRDFSQPVSMTMRSESGAEQVWQITCIVNLNRANDILQFAVANQVGSSQIDAENHTIVFHMLYGTQVTALSPEISISEQASVTPASASARDFTESQVYQVTSQSLEAQNWTVTCVVDPNRENKIISLVVPGQIGQTMWDENQSAYIFHMPYGTNIRQLTPALTISIEATVTPTSRTPLDFSQAQTYTVTAQGGEVQAWTVKCVVDPNRANDILTLSIDLQVGESFIDANLHTVLFHMPYGTDITTLRPTYTLSERASGNPLSGATRDFTNPVIYAILSDSQELQNWTVTCIVDPNTENKILGFSIPGQAGSSVIDATAHTVTLSVPYGTMIRDVLPTMTVSAEATLRPGSSEVVNLRQPVLYTVTSQSGASQTWTVTCNVLPNTQKNIEQFTVPGQIGDTVIDQANQTVRFEMPYITPVTALTPSLVLSAEATVTPASLTSVDFTQPQTYTVTAQDNSQQIWTVTCIRRNTANDIISFRVAGQVGSTQIDTINHTVIFYLLPGSPVGSITPTLECSPGASVLPVSGRTQDFSSPIPYTVTAENGTPQIWTAAYRIYYEPEEEVAPPPKPPTPPEEQPLKPQELIEKAAPLKTTFVQVSTDSASGITSKTATLSARIIAGGGDLRVGFRYRQAGQADWLYTGTSAQNIAIGGSFSTTLTDLLPGTDYEGEARAANSFGLGEGGITSWKTLAAAAPKVATYEAINLLLSQATLTGTVLDDGGSLITSTGFQWGFNQDSLEEVSTGITKQLQTTISDLKPGQKLIYRAFATNTVATTYGSWQTITVPGLVVTTLKPTQITRSSATLQGQILGTSKILESGFSISPGDVSQILATADAQGSFSVNLQNLKADTKYYYTAYAKTSVGEFRGEIQELIPVNDFPVVETFEATDMTQVLANIGGYIVKNSGYKITDSGFVWGMDPNPDQKISVGPGEDLRTLQYKLVGLKGNTTYYYRAYATNEKGTGYGKTLQFVTTKALKPTVVTQSVSFDHDSWQWVLVGNVSNNGGVPLVEYGFRVSSNQTEWAQLVVGFDVQGDYISRGLQFMDELTSGEYFLRAYAMNPGGMGEGETITFKVPTKPSVIASVDAESIILDHLTLIGSITDTGGPEISCVTTQFKIRKTGESEWTIQGVAQGLFEADDFSFDATALTPGAKYELMAEARNQIGWGSSPIVSFMMNYGKTDRDAVTYLKKQGKTATEIATILKAYYQDTPEAAFAALQFAEFSLSEITNAMKTSTYATNFRNMATLIKKAEFEAVAMAKVMLEYYPLDLSLTAGGHPKVGMLLLLKANGYTPTDLAKVCLEVYQYDVASTVSELRSGGFYSQNEAYLAAFNVYGLDATVQFLWAQAMNFIQRTGQGQMFQVLYEMVDILRNIAKLSVTDAAITLQKLYPTLKPEQLADAYYSAKQSVSQTGEAVRYLFGNNLTEVARALEQTPFKEEQINDYLIKELGATALEMVPIVVNIYRHWMDPKEGCAIIFKTYFNLNAIESAKVLYAAGWTENVVDHPGYGLGNLIWTMKLHFGYTTNAQLIEVFKALGLSPMEVAKRLVSNSGWQWLPAYRLGGYTATDAAAWLKLDWSKYGRRTQIIQTIKMCYEAGYDIADIATALIFHYDLDIAESMVFFVDYTGLSTTVIKEALTKAYGKDPLQSAIEKMKGQPLENILSTLKDTYEIKDPVEVTNLLVKLGYPREAIFEKMIWTYFKSFNQREHLEAFTAYLQLVDSELNRKDAMNAFLRRNNLPEGPEYAGSFLRNSARYSMSEIAEILHTEYQVTLSEALKAFFDTYGAGQEIVYYPFVIKAYGMDMSSYTKYQRNRGISAATSTKELVDIFKITDKIEIANILYKSGYNKEAIQQGFMEAFFRGFISPDVIALMNELNERVFKQGLNAQIETITQKGALQPVSAAIAKLHAAGISLTDMVRALKDLYALSQKEAFTAMTTANIFSYEEVANGVQLVYGGDFVVALIGMWRSKSYGTAEYCFRELERSSGIADRAVIYRYLRMGGFTEEEVAVALYWAAREDMLVTLKEVYDIKSSIELGQKLKQLLGELTNRFYSTTLASYLVSLFPQTTNYEIVQTFLAIGKKVHQDGTDSITGWLRSYANTGKRDARLAGYLGKNNNGLNLEVHTAVEVLQKIGYNVQDTTYYALKCGFTWSQFFKHLIYRYAPENFPTSYYDNNSSSKFVVGYLKPYYSILDIAEGLFGFHQSSGRVLADLISAGLSVEEATYATLWQGGEAAASMVVSLVDNSIGRANAARDQSLRLNAVSATEIVFYNSLAVAYDRKVAGLPYNDPITLEDIAKSLVKYGPGAQYGSNSQYFNHWEVLTAMQNVTRIYLELAKVDMPYTEIALATLRLAGLAVSDAAEMMAQHNVGLSTASIFKAVFGLGFDWFEAVKILAGSGYSFGDSISAVIGNHAYKTVIGIGVLSAITTSAMSSLSSIASLSTYVNYVKQAAVLGFMIGTNASVTDILLHLPNFYLGFAGRLAYAGGRIGYTYIPGAP